MEKLSSKCFAYLVDCQGVVKLEATEVVVIDKKVCCRPITLVNLVCFMKKGDRLKSCYNDATGHRFRKKMIIRLASPLGARKL